MKELDRLAAIRLTISGLALAGCALTLAACNADTSMTRSFGPGEAGGNELRMSSRPPLSLPPDFTRRPERPGVTRPAQPASGAAASVGTGSQGQDALLGAAGPPAAPDIRARISQDAQLEAADPRVTDEIMTWQRPAGQPPVIQRESAGGFWSRLF